ncbi:RNA-binding S4 domain-containing protein [Maritalea mobilis]|uniref:RNA-binding S4 domain-containing protein n=1 Tax=Maritalea mobilis TaxID=483324 RepID=UPI001C93A298|nr:RNA-binding S4 domain-containing protein [Maritalea mobilis]MBY6201152.1 RNA-binding S4 domain-containing protein [Maritalea mobilis]
MTEPKRTDRLDRWLWQARFFKTRSLAARRVSEGAVRVNADRVTKPAASVGEGDVLTFPQGRQIRVVRIAALATRRGPASEAQTLYDDLTPPEDKVAAPARVGPRPTKKTRRDLDAFRGAAEDD